MYICVPTANQSPQKLAKYLKLSFFEILSKALNSSFGRMENLLSPPLLAAFGLDRQEVGCSKL